jgi:predicted phage terminase large subunit-like protein
MVNKFTELEELFEEEGYPCFSRFCSMYFKKQLNMEFFPTQFHRRLSAWLTMYPAGFSKKNLIICMPPRYGKSTLGIRVFLSWCFSYLPRCNFIIAANTIDLAREHVRSIRNTILSEWFRVNFPYGARINSEKHSSEVARSDFFTTSQGGAVKGVGLEGLITGFGAGLKEDGFSGCIICDDLLKEQDYNSKNQRDIVYSWFKTTLISRRNSSNTPIILIMQRLHTDDIVGRLLQEEPNAWNVLKIQGFDELSQTSTWPEAVSSEFLLDLKNSKSSIERYMFWAKYQQEPPDLHLDESTILPAHQWNFYGEREEIYKDVKVHFITMDTAFKTGEQNDESVLQWWGISQDKMYLLDMEHGRWDFNDLIARTKLFYAKCNVYINSKKPRAIYVEDAASGTSLVQYLKKERLPMIAWAPQVGEPKDKVSRAHMASIPLAHGKIYLPENSPVSEFIDQCADFPNEKHDDMVDAFTMAALISKRIYPDVI